MTCSCGGAETIAAEAFLSGLRDLILSPIAADCPFGGNLAHDPDFDAVKVEVNKLSGTDFKLVINKGTAILSGKSKDIRVLAYMALAYLWTECWEELADLFEGLTALAERAFENLFPERPHARFMALAWMSEGRFTDALGQRRPSSNDHSHITRLVEALERLRPIVEKHYPDNPPFPALLYKTAQEWCKLTVPPTTELQRESHSAEPGAPAVPPATQTPSQAVAEVRKCALFLIEKEPQKALGYRILRISRWDAIENAPAATDGRTQIEGPPPQLRVRLGSVLAAQNWKTLLKHSQQAFAGRGGHLWIDLQRYSAVACKALGDDFRSVGESIIAETCRFVERVPDVTGLRFADGTEFCDPATREWLATVCSERNRAVESLPVAVETEDPLEKETREARALAASGKLPEALALLTAGVRTGASARDNFRRTMLMGALLLEAHQPQVALSVMESLDETVREYKLERWEPELALEALERLLAACRMARATAASPQQAALAERQNALLARIGKIDPRKALVLCS